MASTKKAGKQGVAGQKRGKKERAIAPELEAELARVVAAEPPPAVAPIPGPRRYTIDEVRKQVLAVEELLIEGARTPVIYRVLRGTGHPEITRARVSLLVQRVQNDWLTLAKDDERLANRESALRRIHRARQVANGTRTPDGKGWLVKPNHAAIIGYESLLMKLQGTSEAIKVDVDVRYTTAMLEVVGSLTGDQASEYLEEALRQREDAELARRELPALVVEARSKLAVEASADAEE